MPVTNVRSQWVSGNLEFTDAADPSIKLGGFVAVTATSAKASGTLVVPITGRFCSMTTGGVEALTLADGVPGQRLTASLVSDSGDGTLTPATSTGWATCVFADVGDTIEVEFIDTTVGWIVVGAYGTAAPPAFTV